MDDRGFDLLTRRVFAVTSRRSVLAALASVAAVLAGWLTGRSASAQHNPNVCRPLGGACFPSRGVGCCGNAACRQGRCRCGRGQRACGGRCISQNRCCRNRDCGGGQRCQKGRCRCPGQQRRCGKRCVNLQTAKGHCGACGNACPGSSTCRNGVCSVAYRFVRQWNEAGDGQTLSDPSGIAVDRDGFVYVADPGRGRIAVYTGSGEFDRVFRDDVNPNGIDVDAMGEVYITDPGVYSIKSFTSDGAPDLDIPTFPNRSAGLAVGPSGDIYAATPVENNYVDRYDAAGTLIASWSGVVQSPRWTAMGPGGDVYVTDFGLNRVVRFSAVGVFKGSWGGPGARNGRFNAPWGITVDATGRVFVVDTGNQRVQVFSASGEFAGSISGSGIDEPYDVAVSPTGMVYITDTATNSVLQFAPA